MILDDFFTHLDFKHDSPEKGKLLISEPFLFDPSFKRSVVLLVEHGDEGSIGFILNKPINMEVDEALEGFPKFESQLLYGGPVSSNSLFFIHTLGDQLKNSTKILDGLYWGGDFDHLKLLIDTGQVDSSQVIFFAGYSGWGVDQLDNELKEKSWIITDANAERIMNSSQEDLWSETLKGMGKKFAIMASFPEDPSMN